MTRVSALALVLVCGCSTTSVVPASGELVPLQQALEFGDIYVGSDATLQLEVANRGHARQTGWWELAHPFEVISQLDLPGGSSGLLAIRFQPRRAGSFETSLAIGEQTISIRGNGLEPRDCRSLSGACVDATFDLGAGQCVLRPRDDGVACSGRCVANAACSAGSCLGDFIACDDGNACTLDGCSEQSGCVHLVRQCPAATDNPCLAGTCDPTIGCTQTPATDGTPCGARNCRTRTTRVCIAAACVDRALPAPECLDQAAYVKASNAEAGDSFGGRVALSADGSTLAVSSSVESSSATGVDGHQSNNDAMQSGAVYVFRRVAGAWRQEAYLKASNTGAGDAFGYSLALSADGTTLVVGAHLEDTFASNSGAAYVFTRRADVVWVQDAYLKATIAARGDTFGASVAVSADGAVIAVGAPGDDGVGAVHLFQASGGTWAPSRTLKAANAGMGDLFGFSLALSGDGVTVAVAALGEDSNSTGINGSDRNELAPQSGAVYVFRSGGAGWIQEAYVKASNTEAADVFGISVSLSHDGATLAVGAYGEDSSATGLNGNQADNNASQGGAAYVFRRALAGWTQEAYLKAVTTQRGDSFGYSLSLSADGAALAVGAFSENSISTGIDGHAFNGDAPDSGAVFLFRKATTWALEAYLKQSNTEPSDTFGHHVAVSRDATTLAVSAIGEDGSSTGLNGNQFDNAAPASGAVYLFALQ